MAVVSPANRRACHAQAAFAGSKGESLPWLPDFLMEPFVPIIASRQPDRGRDLRDGRPIIPNLLFHSYNIIVVRMIPALVPLLGSPWTVLPSGVHAASLADVAAAFATNAWRRELFDGLVIASTKLRFAGCSTIFLDGSYVTGKPRPGDFDACWDPSGVEPGKLDPVFLDFAAGRAAQKAAFKGEFFPSSMTCADVGQAFVDFFQLDRFTGKQKGIISIPISADPFLSRKVQP